jgi:ribA/ribD-fused uncharacterized protein
MSIAEFKGPYAFLSNFHPSPVFGYPTVENAYQAAKTREKTLRVPFRSCSPGEAKRLGRKLPLREDWESIKLEVMETLLREKFTRHPELAAALKATGDSELVEGNWWGDTFWGVCRGKGENHLGRLLMQLRGTL